MRERVIAFVRKLVSQGRQVFIVCPMLEEDEEEPSPLKAAADYAGHLAKDVFPDLRVSLVHGQMKGVEKERAMSAFAAGGSDILVATTVIEVGIDVPNAALMLVENAERFGLSQLHQLRGRVGRGAYKSYCVLFSDAPGEAIRERLSILCQTNDGFRIAEEDLRLRGPGDFLGVRQHGLPHLKLADLAGDTRLLQEAQQAATSLLQEDPALRKVRNRPLAKEIRRLFSDREGNVQLIKLEERIMTAYEEAAKLRADETVHYNCCQAVVAAFCRETGLDFDTALRLSAHFGAGMRHGSTCGAATGALMVLGLMGKEPALAGAFLKKFKEEHGALDCATLLANIKPPAGRNTAIKWCSTPSEPWKRCFRRKAGY